MPSNKLILLFGMPRSGTTWVGKIFDSHPDLLYLHEPDSIKRLNEIPVFEEAANFTQYKDLVENYVSQIPLLNDPKVTTKRPWFNKNYSSAIREAAFKLSAVLSSLANRVSKKVYLPTIPRVAENQLKQAIIGWKSIESLGRLGVLTRCVPEAKVVHIIRHPCGQIASVLRGEKQHLFTSDTASGEDMDFYRKLFNTQCAKKYGLTESSAESMSITERLAWRWLLINEKALEDQKGNPNSMVLEYESLCERPLEVTKMLFNFTGLNWNQQSEQFIDDSTGSENSAYYSVFKNSVSSALKWKNELDNESISLIASIVSESSLLGSRYIEGSQFR